MQKIRIGNIDSYRMTLTTNAVVWGGMLGVIKAAWRTCTRKPGVRLSKSVGRPNKPNILALAGTLNLTAEDKFLSLIAVKVLSRLSIFMILPTKTLSQQFCIVSIKHLLSFLLVYSRRRKVRQFAKTIDKI